MFTSATLKKLILGNVLFFSISVSAQNNGIFHGSISDGFAMSCAGTTSVIAMPVHLVSFDGVCNDKQVQLSWRTASEINSSHFILERSYCGTRWEFVSKINSVGNAAHLSGYSFNDKLDGTNRRAYYRLKQVDNDGNYEYSKIIKIEACQREAIDFSIYPNPTQGKINFVYNGNPSQVQYFEICNVIGEVLYTSNQFETSLNISMLPSGVYFVRLGLIDHSLTQKLIIGDSN